MAEKAKARGDSPVGSVLVKDNKIIAEGIEGGRTYKDITYHAEIEAIRKARELLDTTDFSDCILVTTHEPCIMCSYVIRHHRIATVIVGKTMDSVGGYSSALPVLKDMTVSSWGVPPKVITGVLKEKCEQL